MQVIEGTKFAGHFLWGSIGSSSKMKSRLLHTGAYLFAKAQDAQNAKEAKPINWWQQGGSAAVGVLWGTDTIVAANGWSKAAKSTKELWANFNCGVVNHSDVSLAQLRGVETGANDSFAEKNIYTKKTLLQTMKTVWQGSVAVLSTVSAVNGVINQYLANRNNDPFTLTERNFSIINKQSLIGNALNKTGHLITWIGRIHVFSSIAEQMYIDYEAQELKENLPKHLFAIGSNGLVPSLGANILCTLPMAFILGRKAAKGVWHTNKSERGFFSECTKLTKEHVLPTFGYKFESARYTKGTSILEKWVSNDFKKAFFPFH